MAGLSKPNSYIQNGIEYNINLNEKTEGTLENGVVISNNLKMVSNSYGSVEKLFDESLPTGYSNTGIMLHSKSYNGKDYYWEFQVTSDCQLFGINNFNYEQTILPFSIYIVNEDNTEDLYYTMQDSIMTNGKWYMICPKLKANQTYRLKANGTGHSAGLTEVYFNVLFKCIIKMNDKYYSFKESNYNSNNQMYNEIVLSNNFLEEYGSSLDDFTKTITINGETFKPIDKFNKFKLISLDENNFELKSIKSKHALLIAKESFSTRLAENIDFFELISEITNNSSIKMTLSIDNGLTWKTWDSVSNSFIDLTNVVPLKEYDTLTEDEKTQWNTFMDEVSVDGINASDLKNIDFNILGTDSMMFAYVFNRDSYEDSCIMSKLQYQFDAYGSYKLLGENDVAIKQGVDNISVTPNRDIELMKVNIGSSGTVNINNGEDIDFPTDEEIDNMVNEVINNVFA